MTDSDYVSQIPPTIFVRRDKNSEGVPVLQMLSITFFFSFLLGILSVARGQTTVATWQGDKKAAVSMTFDDGLGSQFNNAFPILQQHALKGTFFIIAGDYNASAVLTLAADGQEIGSHSVSHESLPGLSTKRLQTELSQSQSILQGLTGQQVAVFAYPYGDYNQTIINLTDNYYIASRTAYTYALNSASPSSFYTLKVIGPHGLDGNADPLVYLKSKVDEAVAGGLWAIEMFHSVGYPGGWDNIPTDTFRTHVEYVAANESSIWAAPMGTVVEYIYERNAASIIPLFSDNTLIQLDLQCGLNSIFDTPLTLLTPCPQGWESGDIYARQGQTEQPVEFVSHNGTLYMMYDAVPDGGIIELSPTLLTVTSSAGSHGTVDPDGETWVVSGSDLLFTATPEAGYEVDQWFVDDNAVQIGGTEYTLSAITEDHTVSVTFKSLTYTISGYCFEPDGITPIDDVLIQTDNDVNDVTDANGFYELTVDYNWSGTVVPTKYAYAFEPNQIQFAAVLEDQNDRNFVGELMSFSISGYVLNDCGMPIKDVTVAADGGNQAITDPNGFYEVWVPYHWSGTVTLNKSDYTFSPSGVEYIAVLSDYSEQNYLAENIYDLDCDDFIGPGDLNIFAENWLGGPDLPGDFYKDDANMVNFLDFADFSRVWLSE